MPPQVHLRPCSDFMDMLRRLISCRIIIIIIIIIIYVIIIMDSPAPPSCVRVHAGTGQTTGHSENNASAPCCAVDSLRRHNIRMITKTKQYYTLLLLPLKIYLIILKHIKTLILLKKLVFVSNFNVFILMFVICVFISA